MSVNTPTTPSVTTNDLEYNSRTDHSICNNSLQNVEEKQCSEISWKDSSKSSHFDVNCNTLQNEQTQNDVMSTENSIHLDTDQSSHTLTDKSVERMEQVPSISNITTSDTPSAPSDETSHETTPSHSNDIESSSVIINTCHQEYGIRRKHHVFMDDCSVFEESTTTAYDNVNLSQIDDFERISWNQEDLRSDRSSMRNTIIHPYFHGHIHQVQGRHTRFMIVIMGFVTLMGIVSFVIATTFQNTFGAVKRIHRGSDVQSIGPSNSPSPIPTSLPSRMPSLSPTTMFHSYIHDTLRNMTTQNQNLTIVKGSSAWNAKVWLLRHDPIMAQLDTNEENDILEKRILQRFALSVLYFAMNERYSLQVDWMDIHECDSIHISCNQDGFVRSLGLDNCQAYGTIPQEIVLLQTLENLIISNNPGVKGSIPSSIGYLKELRQVGIYNNSVEGELPSGLFQLPYLTFLNLSDNVIHGKLKSLSMLPRLEKLALDNNMLTGSLSMMELDKAHYLKVLSLSNNRIEGTLPSNMGEKHRETIQYLYLDGNDLNGDLPAEWSVMTNLKSLALRENHFSGSIPNEWEHLSSLTYLTLGNNMLYGTMPKMFENLMNIKVLDVGGNDLNGTLESSMICNWTYATHIYMQSNFFHGTIAKEFSQLNDLKSLFLFDNNFSGTIPTSICNRTTTESLLHLWVDCDSNAVEPNNVPKVQCDCCSMCF